MARKRRKSSRVPSRPRLLHETRTTVQSCDADLGRDEDGVSCVGRLYQGVVITQAYGRTWLLYKTKWVRSKRKAHSLCDKYVQSDQCVYDVDRADWFSAPPRHILEGRRLG